VLAFYFGPQFAAWLLLFLPVMLIVTVIFIASIIGGIREMSVAYAQAGGYAEQAL
jgi:ABC-type multidrug transport system fused ATPase/permease subunit